jgi:hypothetical protein
MAKTNTLASLELSCPKTSVHDRVKGIALAIKKRKTVCMWDTYVINYLL